MTAISVHNLSKCYKLGVTHAGSVRELVNGMAGRLLGKHAPQARKVLPEHEARVDAEGNFWALKDISFDVQPGEVVGIIGKNGAGKSTLLKLLSRITSPTAGRITLQGRLASLLEVGTGFHPELTGRENLYLNGTILGMTRREIDRQFDRIVDFAGVEGFIDTPVKRYSSGMTVRLGFAVAAHLNPEILIVDEVLAVGDAQFQKKCLDKMQEVSASGRTVLFVSHNLASIRSLTTNALLISRGELVFHGPTADAIRLYTEQDSRRAAGTVSVVHNERPYKGLTRDIEFNELAFIEGNGFEEGTPLQIHVAVQTQRATGEFHLGVTVYRADSTPVGSSFSAPFAAASVGEKVSYRLQVPTESLAPGRYNCSVSLADVRTEGRLLFDALTEVLPFEVHPRGADARVWQYIWGSVRLPELTATQVVSAK